MDRMYNAPFAGRKAGGTMGSPGETAKPAGDPNAPPAKKVPEEELEAIFSRYTHVWLLCPSI